MQDSSHQSSAFDGPNAYTHGAPHLSHVEVRRASETLLGQAISTIDRTDSRVRVLEVGAGDGTYTDYFLQNDLSVIVTEMSEYAVRLLSERYLEDARVVVVRDEDGTWPTYSRETIDLVACMSVLHHIPDYIEYLESCFRILKPGGAFVSWADPLWYPRRSRLNMALDRGSYFLWRLGQGNYSRGIHTRIRRLRGEFDLDRIEDMSEYHVVREGVDEAAIIDLAGKYFGDVQLIKYWSTQASLLQRMGMKFGWVSAFGILATNRRADDEPQ
jgi:SAM-dependent methyltransferase